MGTLLVLIPLSVVDLDGNDDGAVADDDDDEGCNAGFVKSYGCERSTSYSIGLNPLRLYHSSGPFSDMCCHAYSYLSIIPGMQLPLYTSTAPFLWCAH